MQERGWGARLVWIMILLCVCSSACEERRTRSPNAPVRDAGAQGGEREEEELGSARVAALKETPRSERIVASSAQIPARPRRIVSLAPNVTELLFALGVEADRVVGVTRFCDRPAAQVEKIEKVGGFVDPDMEKILSLEPDLIVGMKVGDAKLVEKLEAAKLRHVFFEMDTLPQTLEAIEVLGEVVDASEASTKLHAQIEAQLGEAPQAPEGLATLFLVGREPLVMAGEGTFAMELVTRAGGVSATGKQGYVMVDMEYVLKLNPAVIIDTSMSGEGDDFWAPYASLRAVKRGAVYGLDPSLIRPGPGLIEAHEVLKSFYDAEEKKEEGASE